MSVEFDMGVCNRDREVEIIFGRVSPSVRVGTPGHLERPCIDFACGLCRSLVCRAHGWGAAVDISCFQRADWEHDGVCITGAVVIRLLDAAIAVSQRWSHRRVRFSVG